MRIVFVIKIVTIDNRWLALENPAQVIPLPINTTIIINDAWQFDTYAEAEKMIPNLHKGYFYQIEKLYKV